VRQARVSGCGGAQVRLILWHDDGPPCEPRHVPARVKKALDPSGVLHLALARQLARYGLCLTSASTKIVSTSAGARAS